MKRGWVFFIGAAIVTAAGLVGLERPAMSSAVSPPPLRAGSERECGKAGGGDSTTAGVKGTVAYDGSCSGYPEEPCGRPVF